MSLFLGNVEFVLDEYPEKISLGGIQAMGVHKHPGGSKDLQPLGAFDDPIEWEGVFWFTGAMDRVQLLNNMRIAGDPVIMQIGSMSCNVVITEFHWDYCNDYYIPYHIKLETAEILTTVGSASSTTNLQTAQVGGSGSGTQTSLSPADLSNSASAPTYQQPGAAAETSFGTIISTMSPASVATVSTQSQPIYPVAAGDTLWSIGFKFGIPWTSIASANNITNPNGITVGQQLIIPNPVVS